MPQRCFARCFNESTRSEFLKSDDRRGISRRRQAIKRFDWRRADSANEREPTAVESLGRTSRALSRHLLPENFVEGSGKKGSRGSFAPVLPLAARYQQDTGAGYQRNESPTVVKRDDLRTRLRIDSCQLPRRDVKYTELNVHFAL